MFQQRPLMWIGLAIMAAAAWFDSTPTAILGASMYWRGYQDF